MGTDFGVIPSRERALTGGLEMVMTATPSARTSMVVVPLAIFGDGNDNAAGQEWWVSGLRVTGPLGLMGVYACDSEDLQIAQRTSRGQHSDLFIQKNHNSFLTDYGV